MNDGVPIISQASIRHAMYNVPATAAVKERSSNMQGLGESVEEQPSLVLQAAEFQVGSLPEVM